MRRECGKLGDVKSWHEWVIGGAGGCLMIGMAWLWAVNATVVFWIVIAYIAGCALFFWRR